MTDAQKEASRKNGARGGRPKRYDYSWFDDYREELLAADDPLDRVKIGQRILARALCNSIDGKGQRERDQSIIQFVKAMAAIVPKERLLDAEKKIRGGAGEARASKVKRAPKTQRRKPTATDGPIRG